MSLASHDYVVDITQVQGLADYDLFRQAQQNLIMTLHLL